MLAHLFLLKPGSDGSPDGTPDRLGVEHDEPFANREGWYDHVATLEVERLGHEPLDDVVDTLQAVWAKTQHGRGDWTGNAEVRWVSGPGLRSSHVGDVIVLEGSGGRAAFEVAFEVAFEGFRRIDVTPDQIPPARTVPPLPSELE